MLIITIAVPDRGTSDTTEAYETVRDTVESFGGEVLQAHTVEQDGDDIDAIPAR